MDAFSFSLNFPFLAPDQIVRPRRRQRGSFQGRPAAVSVPRILLIDSDPEFASAFSLAANGWHAPVRILPSVLSMDQRLQWNYDLVLLDLETVGAEFVSEVADDIRRDYGAIPVLAIGDEDDWKLDAGNQTGSIHGFLDKTWGAKSMFGDVIQQFATAQGILFDH